ncbi:MAG TPA: hypothetical protein VGD63_06360 [Steroidobacteraceae bacterium]
MNTLLDNFLVGVLLLASVGYALYKLGPRNLRKRILTLVGRSTAAGKVQGACGGCDNCGDAANPPQTASADIRIPVAKIGRRP